MKKIYLLFLLCFFVEWSQAQIINIPDANFKNALLNTNCVDIDGDGVLDGDADTNDDGEIQLSEALLVSGIEIVMGSPNFDEMINSIVGIEAFVNLKNLEISPHGITIPDLSQNTLLESIILQNGGLETIDLSYHPNLIEVDFFNNVLTSLDVSQNTNLESIRVSFNEYLPAIDVTQNINLKKFFASATAFTEIDVSQNINLINFSLQYCFVSIIDLRYNTALETIEINGNQNLQAIYIKNGSIATYTQIGYSDQPVQYICVDVGEAQIFDNNYISTQAVIDSNCPSAPNTLNIADNDIEETITVYPNPANDILYIKTNTLLTSVTVSTIDGRQLQTSKSLENYRNNIYELDMSKLAQGIYMVTTATESYLKTYKIVKE